MGLAERWYMQDRARLRRAYREHRPRERPSNLVLAVRDTSMPGFRRRLTAFGVSVESLLVGASALLSVLWFWHTPH